MFARGRGGSGSSNNQPASASQRVTVFKYLHSQSVGSSCGRSHFEI
jgi:hypothetical protein